MFQNIMLPLDGSRLSEMARPLAVRVAQTSGARLHLVRIHVPAAPTAEVIATSNYDEMLREWEREALDAALARVLDAGIDATAELLEGPVVSGLERYVRAMGIDLTVMTTHSRGVLARAVMGSVAEEFVRKTDVPVLLLRPPADAEDTLHELTLIKRILVPLDGTAESESVLPHAVQFARLAGARLILTQMVIAPYAPFNATLREQAEAYLQDVAESLPTGLCSTHVATSPEGVPTGLIRAAIQKDADLIAMATHGRSGWARLALGSVAETMLHRTVTPMLLIRGVATGQPLASQHSMQSESARSGA